MACTISCCPTLPALSHLLASATLSSENQKCLVAMSCIATYSGIHISSNGNIASITTVPDPTRSRAVTAKPLTHDYGWHGAIAGAALALFFEIPQHAQF